MERKIRVLDKLVSEMIAAGEVVESPASVVKELCENSMDAGATHIEIEIQGGGIELIRVTDDGRGMSGADAQTAFLRHATSKISCADDLGHIESLGFRGEALAAVAAVSEVELTTCADADRGVTVRVRGGEQLLCETAYCSRGATVTVTDLFYNTPARKKFLRSVQAESAQVAALVDRMALSNPGVSFCLRRNGKDSLRTPGDGNLYNAVYAVYGSQFASSLLKVERETDGIRVYGYVSKPEYSRANRKLQNFFLNGRMVSSKLLSSALESAYKNALLTGTFPQSVLYVQMEPGEVDVNVHPSKAVVKFSNEDMVRNAVRNAVCGVLDRQDGRVHIRSVDIMPDEPGKPPATQKEYAYRAPHAPLGYGTETAADTGWMRDAGLPAFVVRDSAPHVEIQTGILDNQAAEIQEPYPSEATGSDTDTLPQETRQEDPETAEEPLEEMLPYRVLGEAFDSFIIVQQGEEILFIDKHAAHERMIYNALISRGDAMARQVLLEPLVIRLSREECHQLLAARGQLEKLGFEIEDFGAGNIRVSEIPAMLDSQDITQIFTQITAELSRSGTVSSSAMDHIMHTIACKAAVKANIRSDMQESRTLVEDLMKLGNIKYCPHGRPTTFAVSRKELERYFRRT